VVSFSKASRPLSRAVWYRALLLISFSSYAIYLFFTTILIQFMHALLVTPLTALEIDIVQIFVGLPTVVLIGFVLQSTQNEILNKIRKYRAASSPSSDSNE
jgi:cellulose synthase/poly-beta-1,6-N-acetylglucosamine synthase-like glycosyltransferase